MSKADKLCPRGKIMRKGYVRAAFTRADGTRVTETRVNRRCIKDRGYRGHGPVTLPEADGKVSLRKYGWAASKSQAERRRALRRASKKYGTLTTLRHLGLRRNQQTHDAPHKEIFNNDMEYMMRLYRREKNSGQQGGCNCSGNQTGGEEYCSGNQIDGGEYCSGNQIGGEEYCSGNQTGGEYAEETAAWLSREMQQGSAKQLSLKIFEVIENDNEKYVFQSFDKEDTINTTDEHVKLLLKKNYIGITMSYKDKKNDKPEMIVGHVIFRFMDGTAEVEKFSAKEEYRKSFAEFLEKLFRGFGMSHIKITVKYSQFNAKQYIEFWESSGYKLQKVDDKETGVAIFTDQL